MNRKGVPYLLYPIVLIILIFSMESCNQDGDGSGPSIDSTFQSVIDTFALLNGLDLQLDPNGVYYYPVTLNPGGTSGNGGIVSIYYEAEVLNGNTIDIFDENDGDPLIVKQGASAIYPVGLDFGLGYMNEGEEYGFILIPDLAYEQYDYAGIPPNSIIHIRVRLVLVENEIIIQNQENAAINQFIIDGELNDTTKVPVDLVDRLPSGVVFKRLSANPTQPTPASGDSLAIEYTARTLDTSRVVDVRPGSDPLRYQFGVSETIPGFDLGVVNMRLGERALIVVPSSLGYQGSAQVIPGYIKGTVFQNKIIPEYALSVLPYEVLVFEARLNEIY